MRHQLWLWIVCAAALWAIRGMAQLDEISEHEAASGLTAALEKGAQSAVATLGRQDGFFGNPKVKIPLPEPLSKVEAGMRKVGMGKYADDLVLTLNRSAESAVPEARPLFVDAAGKMSIADAKSVLTEGGTAGTAYLRKATEPQLHDRFLPVVQRATQKVGLAQKYNAYAKHAATFGLMKKEDANLDEYVTRKALDGLFLTLGEEEQKLREDPASAGSAIITKVFGALR